MHNAAFGDHMKRWGQLAAGVAEHASDAAFLQPVQEQLVQARAEAWEAKQRQLRHRAAAHLATRDLEAAMERAHEAASRLQQGLLSKYGATDPKLVVFGIHPRRVGKVGARAKALEALAALQGGASPHRAGEPAAQAAAVPAAGGTVPQAEADTAWRGGNVPQAEADAAAPARTAPTGGGEAPQAEADVVTGGGTAPPAVEAAPPAIRDAMLPASAFQRAVRSTWPLMRVSPPQDVAWETLSGAPPALVEAPQHASLPSYRIN